ncbi:MAG: hypothetical protein HEQ32_08200 [Vampirovibrio sp.]
MTYCPHSLFSFFSQTTPMIPPSHAMKKQPLLHSKSTLGPVSVSQRQGQLYRNLIPSSATGNVKALLEHTLEWAEVNHQTVKPQEIQALATGFQNALNQNEAQVLEHLSTQLGINPNHPHFKSLQGALSKKIKGTPSLNNTVKWLLALEYLPSSLMMLWVTNGIYTEMQARDKITANEKKVLFRQEIARQFVGASLHLFRTLLGFEAVVWIMALMKRHQNVNEWGKRLEANANPFKQKMGEHLIRGSHQMQSLWNHLYGDTNQTIASMTSLILMNILTYGITRPLMVNAAFWGIHNKDTPPEPKSNDVPEAKSVQTTSARSLDLKSV